MTATALLLWAKGYIKQDHVTLTMALDALALFILGALA